MHVSIIIYNNLYNINDLYVKKKKKKIYSKNFILAFN